MARNFDGAADYLLNTSTKVVSAYPYTMAAWVLASSSATGVMVSLSFATSSNFRQLFQLASGKVVAETRGTSSAYLNWTTTSTVTNNVWTHAAGVFTNSSATILSYVNGDSTGSSASNGTAPVLHASTDNFSVGRNTDSSPDSYLACDLAEIGIWDVALTAAEVAMLAAGYPPLLIRPTALKGYWPLHGRAGASGAEEDWVGTRSLTATSDPAVVDHPRIIYPRRQIWVPKAVAASLPTLSASTYKPGTLTADGWQPRVTAS